MHKREEVMLEIIYQNHALRSVGWGSEVIFGARLAKTLSVRPLPSTDLCDLSALSLVRKIEVDVSVDKIESK